MKNILLIIISVLLLCIPLSLSAKFGGYAEIGKDINGNICYTDIKLKYDIPCYFLYLTPYGRQMTWFYQDEEKGNPFRDVYIIGFETKYDSIIFGIEHYCSHAVSCGDCFYRKPDEPPLAYNFTKLFLRYEF